MNKRQTTDMNACTRGRFTKCVACPTAYHQSEYCIGAGSKLYNTTQLLCPLHFKPHKSSSQHNRISVTWCFVCCQTGELIGCSRCPAAYHSDCLAANDARYVIDDDDEDETNTNTNGNANNKSVKKKTTTPVKPKESVSNIDKNNWLCEDCLVNKRPLYGEIVWAKVGQYRWWPAQICLPRSLGNALVQCQVGEFTVKFYGTFDYHALNLGRCFTFAEGDEGGTSRNSTGGSSAASLSSLPSSGGNTLERAFARACRQAKHAHKEVERLRAARAPKTPLNKYNFQMIKTNRPYGNVQISKVQLQDVPKCDCSPNEVAPCGSDSSCMNRMLKYECHPLVCPAGARCLNQRFMKREYPKQEPINAGDRGWGLRTLVDIKKGDFVNEYVGEIIDDEECKRRMDLAHANNITNFYFLTIDQGRVIDAGPKGNLARFANHSCDPNMETQKWVVNGDIRVGLFACKDIPTGTELTFNYQLDCLSNNKAVCKCGTKVCAGFIGDRPKQLPTSSSQQQLQNGSGSGSKSATNNGNNNKKRKISDAVELLSTSAASNESKKSKSELSRIRSQSTIVSNLK